MATLNPRGTVVTADQSYRADVLCDRVSSRKSREDRRPGWRARGRCGGQLVMPGGTILTPTWNCPSWATTSEDSSRHSAASPGHTMIIDFVIPNPKERLLEAYKKWAGLGGEAASDYSFHVAVTWWDDSVIATWHARNEHGVNSFKHFNGLQGSIMARDEVLVNSFPAPRAGAICTCTPRMASWCSICSAAPEAA